MFVKCFGFFGLDKIKLSTKLNSKFVQKEIDFNFQ
jgi:hypothetical protein